MTKDALSLQFLEFSRESLVQVVAEASGGSETEPVDQVRYLGSYFSNPEMRAKGLIVEWPYVDRHFLEEYSRYYATALHPPNPKATRIHFFDEHVEKKVFADLLLRASNGKRDEATAFLQKKYLGFCVVRPLPSSPIGRTIIGVYDHEEKRRHFTAAPQPYDVHVCGLRLVVRGVPFQQQEQAVGACATTALWCALARVMKTDGQRAPTPFAVTDAATKHMLANRAFPAVAGLKDEQMLEAIRQFGYSPLFVEPETEYGLFKLIVRTYLRSGIPVIMRVNPPNNVLEGHAVALVGFREDDSHEPAKSIEVAVDKTTLRATGTTRLYVHDDRLGPYARGSWTTNDGGFLGLQLRPHEAGYGHFDDAEEVNAAMVPLYPKIRLSAQDLIAFGAQLWPWLSSLTGHHEGLRVDFRFQLAGDFQRELMDSNVDSERSVGALQRLVLSRYVGIIKFSVKDDLLAYFAYDTTDIRRDYPKAAPLIAMIPKSEGFVEEFEKYARDYANDALVV